MTRPPRLSKLFVSLCSLCACAGLLASPAAVWAQTPDKVAQTDAGTTGAETSAPSTGSLSFDLNEAFDDEADEDQRLPYRQIRRFALVYAAVKNRYVEPVKDDELVDAAIEGMLNKLDPHSNYLNKDDMDSLMESTEGEFAGLGIEVSSTSKKVSVIAPIEGSPADKAGIMPGDEIVEVNGKRVGDHPVTEVVNELRGNPGTTAKLKIRRHKQKKLLNFNIKRDVVKIKSVRSKQLDSDIAYIRISQFQERTVPDLVESLKQFKTPPKALILDLRNDPGGLLGAAVGVAGAFIKPGQTVVYTKSRGEVNLKYKVDPKDYATGADDPLASLPEWTRKVPMVVLINVGSASASEIVSGALQDYQRATILGNRSFGKGSVQVVFPLDDETGVKLTIARYYTPKGRSIQVTGIVPDVPVSDTAAGDLFAYPREEDLRDHLENDTQPQAKAQEEDKFVDPSKYSFEFGSDKDFQLQQAIRQIKGETVDHGTAQNPPAKPADSKTDKSVPESSEGSGSDKSSDEADKPAANDDDGFLEDLRPPAIRD